MHDTHTWMGPTCPDLAPTLPRAGDSLSYHNTQPFSTKDQDNDSTTENCAERYKGGWWYSKCHLSNLNGLYLRGPHDSFANGVNWKTGRGYNYSYKVSEMKLRPA